MATGFYSRPSASLGYWRGGGSDGNPLAQGQGSGMGPKNQGAGLLSQGLGSVGGGDWHPTVIYLLGLIVVEMFVFGFIARTLK